ncbi:MAG: NADH-quinone oxidoreductase subunit N [Fimbriimonas sp.]
MQPFNFAPVELEWSAILPMVVVALTGILAMIIDLIWPKRTNNAIVATCLVGLLAAAGCAVLQLTLSPLDTAGGMVIMDRFSTTMTLVLLSASFIAVLFSEGYLREKRIPYSEFYFLFMWSTLGGLVMCSTKNLLMVFLGVEVLSIALYVLAGLSRNEEKSEESALKYFFLGAFASAFLLYGMAFFYGASGSLQLEGLARAWDLNGPGMRAMILMGLALVLIGLGFKASWVPFHQWTPDVYQGAPTNVVAFMATGAKVAPIAILWRVLDANSALAPTFVPALSVIAILTMTVGNLAALAQKDIKRVLGYSSIAHGGYILVGILAHIQSPDKVGFETVAYYLFGYTFMTVGAFAVISMCAKEGAEGTQLKDLYGLFKRAPLAAAAMVIFMASLIGIPPTVGFFGKFQIFNDAMSAGLVPLAIALAINSIISTFYYLSIAKAAFVEDDEQVHPTSAFHPGLAVACALCIAGVIGVGVFVEAVRNLVAIR